MDDSACPLSLGSSVALAVLEKLFEVEKSLKNEQFQFNQETKTLLEDIAEAVKKLECMRKTTIDLLEIESIEISRLRFILWRLPGNIAREIEDAVFAARKSNTDEISQLHIAIEKVKYEIELLNGQLNTLEKKNFDLRKEQEATAESHQKVIVSLNMKMKEKAESNFTKKEIYDRNKFTEDKVAYYQGLLNALNDELDAERAAFNQNKENLEKMMTDLKKQKDDEIKKSLQKKKEMSKMNAEIADIKEKFRSKTGAITEQAVEQEELEDGMKILQEQFQEDLKQPEQLVKARLQYEASLKELIESAKINQVDLLRKIRQAKERFAKIKARNTDLKGKNKILTDQLKTALQEEQDYRITMLTTQEVVDKLEETINEKRNFLTKRLTDIKALEEAIENLRMLSRTTVESYRKQIEFLKGNWAKESEKSVVNQWKIIHLQKQHELWVKTEEANMQEIIQKIDNVEKTRAVIVEESLTCDEKIIEHEEKIEELSEQLKEEEEIFSQVEQDVTDKLKVMEEEYAVSAEKAREKEEELEVYVPKMKMFEEEYEENVKEYEALKYHVSAQNREQESLKYGIALMKKETARYTNDKKLLKDLLKEGRNEELLRMKGRMNCVYILEKNIYEVEQKLRHLILENYRIKKAIQLVKEDIANLQREGQNNIDSVEKMNLELEELQDTYVKMWEETLNTIKKFKEDSQVTMEDIVELIRKLCKREEKLRIICGWLRRNVDNLEYIIDYKESNMDITVTDEEKKKTESYHKTTEKGTMAA
ncbi:coiled-coil domain-containing protein 175 isoform X2 [Notamacropus eugenii]|uniref:coiled-coil domain-containing protein 175 isoform X2 n=1 Tax=Notamacropus eugenii TaxID=9315 RepID=UPI003B67DE0E